MSGFTKNVTRFGRNSEPI